MIKMHLKLVNIIYQFLPDMSGSQMEFREDCMYYHYVQLQTCHLPLTDGSIALNLACEKLQSESSSVQKLSC